MGRLATALLPTVFVLTACGLSTAADEIRVSAASSLTDAFADVEVAFEAQNPGVDVVLNLGGSSALREQILAGASVDVYASADISNMDAVVGAGAASAAPRLFATNELQIVVPLGNPGRVFSLDDFTRGELVIGLCAAPVPCGALARRALQHAGVTPAIDTNEPNVRALLTKVELGEIDAGIVYTTDVADRARPVEGIAISEDDNIASTYPIVELADAPNPTGAAAFVAFVLSVAGRQILTDHGFGAP